MKISPIMASVPVYSSMKHCGIKTKHYNSEPERPNYYYGLINFCGVENTSPLGNGEKIALFQEISKVEEKDIKKGSLGKVYKVSLPNRPDLAVKEFSEVYEGRNPQKEAATLQKLPKECNRVQKFVDLITKDDKQYLVTTFQNGQSLSNLKDKMSDKLIQNILDELFKIEKTGLAFYDYSMANIVYKGDEPRFFDFEVAKEQSFDRINYEAEGDLTHLSRNTYYPLTTNLGGFEIRTVGKIIGEFEKYSDGEKRSTDYVRRYLKQVSEFYKKTGNLFQEKGEPIPESAVKYSFTLAQLFENPSDEIVSIEKQSMRLRELITEYWFRNDPNLEHDDKLYADGNAFVQNLQTRFWLVQEEIWKLKQISGSSNVQQYCKVTSDFLQKLYDKEVTYFTKKLCR